MDGQPIHAEEVDERIRIDLHDLALAQYRLRAERLDDLVRARRAVAASAAKEGGRERVEVLLTAPDPPRLDVPIRCARLRGAGQDWIKWRAGAVVTRV